MMTSQPSRDPHVTTTHDNPRLIAARNVDAAATLADDTARNLAIYVDAWDRHGGPLTRAQMIHQLDRWRDAWANYQAALSAEFRARRAQ